MKALEDIFPDYVKANTADLPDWIPAPVRDYATHNAFDKRALPLLHDERMRAVWRELSRHRESGDAVLVAVFQQLQGVAGGNTPTARVDIDEELKSLRAAMALLKKENATEIWPDECELTASVSRTIDHLVKRIKKREREAAPFTIERRRGEDVARICFGRVAAIMSAHFGSTLYTTSAKITAVLTGAAVTKKKAENWAKGSQ